MSNLGLKKIDALLLRTLLIHFFSILLLVLFVLVLQSFLVLFKDIVGKGLGAYVYAKMLFYIGLAMFPNAFPISILVSSLLAFGNFSENFELTAMRSVGLSLQRIFRLPLLFICLVSGALYYFQEYVYPTTRPKVFALVQDVTQKKAALFIQEGIFCNNIPGYGIRVNKKINAQGDMEGIVVYDHTKKYGAVAITSAEKGKLHTTPAGDCLIMELFQGHNYVEPLPVRAKNEADGAEEKTFYRTNFAQQKITIGLEALQLGSTRAGFAYDARTRTRPQLTAMVDERRQRVRQERAYSKELLVQKAMRYGPKLGAWSDANGADVAVAAPSEGQPLDPSTDFNAFRAQLMRNASSAQGARMTCDPFARRVVHRTLRSLAQTQASLQNQRQDEMHAEYNLRAAAFEQEQRLAVAVRCLIMFLLAAPLGCIIRKGGFGVSVLLSSCFMLLEYVLSMFGREWVEDGSLAPFLGAWMANVALVPFCVYFLIQGQRGTGLSLAFRAWPFWRKGAKSRRAAAP